MSDKIKDLNSPSPWNMRIWDEAKHQWLCDGEDDALPYYGFDIRGGEVTAFQGIDWIYKQHKRWNDFIWERSTGLTDKNGKEIYEGDVVKQVGSNLVCPVEFKYGGFIPFTSDMMTFDNDYCEVIGNIHEPPKDFRPEHLKLMGVSISKGGEE